MALVAAAAVSDMTVNTTITYNKIRTNGTNGNKILYYGEFKTDVFKPDDFIIQSVASTFFPDTINIIIGAKAAIEYQRIFTLSPPNKKEFNIYSSVGTPILRCLPMQPHKCSNVQPVNEINRLSDITIDIKSGIIVLTDNSMSEFKKCHLPSSKKQYILADIDRLSKKLDTKAFILVITDDLHKQFINVGFDINGYFMDVIVYPSSSILNCLDEFIHGKIIKSVDDNYESVYDIGPNNILSMVSSPHSTTTIQIGTKGRIRVNARGPYTISFCMVVEMTEDVPLVFNTTTPNTVLTNIFNPGEFNSEYISVDELDIIIKLSIDNYTLSTTPKMPQDSVITFIQNYLIENEYLVNLAKLLTLKTDDNLIKLLQRLITNTEESTHTLISHIMAISAAKRMKLIHNIDDRDQYVPAPPAMDRYSSAPMRASTNPYGY